MASPTVLSETALMYDGSVIVACEGFVADIVKPVGLLLLAVGGSS